MRISDWSSDVCSSDLVQRGPLFVVLGLEQQVQAVEHRPGDVPVEVVGLQVQGVGVGKEVRQAVGDLPAFGGGQADVDRGGGGAGGAPAAIGDANRAPVAASIVTRDFIAGEIGRAHV